MKDLQRPDGSWSWFKDMSGSMYMTTTVTEMLVRLNKMCGRQENTEDMLDRAFKFMGKDVVKMVAQMKDEEKKGISQSFPSFNSLHYLYLCALDGRKLPSDVAAANEYLINLMKKEIKNQSIYEKALSAIILQENGNTMKAKEYAQSLKQYTVMTEEMGRYYDTGRANYSWCDYKIPTEVAAIEALKSITPEDQTTINEMLRWLLQEKRTQTWDTPINSVDAVYAFLNGS
jgi:sRNA-binding regulator protein Hfq